MALVTLRVIDGPGRGMTYKQISTPITIGREEGNVVQINDERISRFHLKISESDDAVILTDLQSTNGTRVNGEIIQLWTLRPGDLISVGRSVILVGTQGEIARRLKNIRKIDVRHNATMGYPADSIPFLGHQADLSVRSDDRLSSSLALQKEIFPGLSSGEISSLYTMSPPNPPSNLQLKQTAQLAEFLQYMHLRIRYLVETVEYDKDAEKISLSAAQWQNLLDLYGWLATYIHSVTEP